MSLKAHAFDPAWKHHCDCQRRASFARSSGRGRIGRRRHARDDHPLCDRCWRALLDHYRPVPPARRWLPDELLATLLVHTAEWRKADATPLPAQRGALHGDLAAA